MSVDPKQQQLDKTTKIIGFKVTEEELHNTIYPVMHDCYDLGIIEHDTLTSFLRFCVQFWMGHYRMKKQQFDMSQREIEEEKKKGEKGDGPLCLSRELGLLLCKESCPSLCDVGGKVGDCVNSPVIDLQVLSCCVQCVDCQLVVDADRPDGVVGHFI